MRRRESKSKPRKQSMLLCRSLYILTTPLYMAALVLAHILVWIHLYRKEEMEDMPTAMEWLAMWNNMTYDEDGRIVIEM